MKLKLNIFTLVMIMFSLTLACDDGESTTDPVDQEPAGETIVEKYGQLKLNGKNLVDKDGNVVVLRGMSLFWSNWGGQFYTKGTVKWLKDDWKCTIVRAALGIETGGYLDNPVDEFQKIKTVIDACIEEGIYVFVDWHDHHAEDHAAEAITFFDNIAATYGDKPNIIYEIYNEPLNVSWNGVIKPYAEQVIAAIRKHDPDNIIVVGTRNWAQEMQEVIGNRIDDENVAYSFHFYSSTHTQTLRNKALQAINAGIPVIVTEWGLSEASGNGDINMAMYADWKTFLEDNNLSWCNWSIITKNETSAALKPGVTKLSDWTEDEISESGTIIRNYLIEKNSELFD